MDVLKSKGKLKALKRILIKHGKIEDIQAQEFNKVFYLFLSIGMSYYQEGCNISELTVTPRNSITIKYC
jgi:hypothetical protein